MLSRACVASLAVVLLILSGYNATYGVAAASQAPAALSLTVMLQPIPADGGTYPSLMVTLSDASGNPTMTLSSMVIFLSSSQEGFATVPHSVELMAGHTYVLVNVTTTESPGTTAITAASSGVKSASTNLQTVGTGQAPTQLALSVSPSKTLQSSVGNDALIIVRLVNGSNLPAYSNVDTQIVITSSNSSVVGDTIRVVIPRGMSYAYSSIKAKDPGTTTFTALSAGLAASSASLTVLPLPFLVSLAASPNLISVNGTATITVVASLAGQGLSGANVSFSSNIGTLKPTRSSTDETGRALTTFTPTGPGVAAVVASVAHPFVGIRNASATIIVSESPPVVERSAFQLVYPFIPAILAVAIVVIVVVAIRRVLRRRTASAEEEGEEG